LIALEEPGSPFFHDFRAIEGASRLRDDYVLALARGQRVLHFGFLDSPFLDGKVTKGELLHLRLKEEASALFGVDIDPAALERYRELTGDSENVIWDVQAALAGAAEEALSQPGRRRFDLIVFAEILEHLRNPGLALDALRTLCGIHGATLCVTVPNALSAVAFANAVDGIESVHPDHRAYYSPYTLRKLLEDSRFDVQELSFYSSPGTLRTPGLTKHGVIAVARAR
jgi:2-polyprenyl-3-methyl-5-hydroxy-6-metoxy-1,4-benzoquinol methylase